ncbi:MAG: 30S ribosomal protein S21 [Cytophagales bacterium]|nr:30S ribosomal protein S21 [Cytophagales bacterium]
MIVVHLKEDEGVDKALKRFKRKFEKVGILKELRERMQYKKPSMKRREQKLKAIYRKKLLAQENY